jgi:hypothetical protein
MTSADSLIVLIVDDDTRMRAAMQRLLKTVGLHSELFATPEDFLRHKLPNGPTCRGGHSDSCHFYHRPRRHPHDGPSHEVRGSGVSDETVSYQDLIDASASLETGQPNETRAERDHRIEGTLRELDCARARGDAAYCFGHAHEADCLDTRHHRSVAG